MIPVAKVKAILRSHGIKPRKKLGQHFLLDDRLMERLADHASLGPQDVVLDVGAGLGFLTEILARRGCRVLAVEVDRKLIGVLEERLASFPNVEIIQGDVFKVDLPGFNKTVSAPPYHVISRLIFWLLGKPSLEVAVLVVQAELARRLVAEPGTDDYGRLTITAYYRADIDLLEPVPRDRFWPPPDVDSMAVRLVKRPPPFKVEDEDLFLALVRGLFSHRNKLVKRALRLALATLGMGEREARDLALRSPHASRRVRELTPEDVAEVANYVARELRRGHANPMD